MRKLTLVVAGLCIAGAAALLVAAKAMADDPEPTIVEYRQAGATYGPYTAWKRAVLPASEDAQDATPINEDRSAYTWVRLVSGPPACTFTAIVETRQVRDRGKLVPSSIGGGRDCNDSQRSCGFFGRGYSVYGASGKACTGFGIPLCGGICQ